MRILILLMIIGLAYFNSFSGPLVFDDKPAISGNPTIREWGTALVPPDTGSSVTGRPPTGAGVFSEIVPVRWKPA